MSPSQKTLLTGRILRFGADPFLSPPTEAIHVDEAILLDGELIVDIGSPRAPQPKPSGGPFQSRTKEHQQS
jgi:hypothetical protein